MTLMQSHHLASIWDREISVVARDQPTPSPELHLHHVLVDLTLRTASGSAQVWPKRTMSSTMQHYLHQHYYCCVAHVVVRPTWRRRLMPSSAPAFTTDTGGVQMPAKALSRKCSNHSAVASTKLQASKSGAA